MTTIATDGWQNFMTMPVGLNPHVLKIWFDCCGDPGTWLVRYDGRLGDDQSSVVDVWAELGSDGKNARWTLVPRGDPTTIKNGDGVPVYAGALLDKYARENPARGYNTSYGTWVMPFKVVIERK